jgi:hypothetical protein
MPKALTDEGASAAQGAKSREQGANYEPEKIFNSII